MPRGCTIVVLAAVAALGGCASNPSLQKVADTVVDKTQPVTQYVTIGLPNVQWPTGAEYYNDEKPQDVVANGPEACGRDLDHQVLRGQWPPCQGEKPVLAGPQLLPTSGNAEAQRETRPWKERDVYPWPAGIEIPEHP